MNDLIQALIGLAGVALLSLGTLAVHRLAGWLKLGADDKVRGYLLETLDRAVDFGEAEARKRLTGPEGLVVGDVSKSRVTNLATELAREYAATRVPDALRRFGINSAGLDQMIRARMTVPPRG